MFKIFRLFILIITTTYAIPFAATADVYVRQLSVGSSAYIGQASGKPRIAIAQNTAQSPPHVARRTTSHTSARASVQQQTRGKAQQRLRINDVSQAGLDNQPTVPSVRGGVRVVADN